MVFVAIDHNKFKTRIKEIIEGTTTLFDVANPSKSLLRQVIVGTPPNKDYHDLNHPALVITNSERWMEERHRGPDVANARSSVQTTIRYDILLLVQMDDSNEAEKEVDRFWKAFEERMYNFLTLEQVAGGDPLCKDIIFEKTRRIPQLEGQEIDGFISTIQILVDPNG